jgi:hypothetical protein
MKQSPGLLCLALALIVLGCTEKHSPVSVLQANPHYFYFRGKSTVFITSDHHYGAIIDLDFDYVKYMDYLETYGMNLTRIYPGGMFEPPDKYQKGSPLGPLPGRQLLPWRKTTQPGANPLLAKAGQPSYKFDLGQWNPEYFERLKDFVKLAGEKGIVVEVPFFNGMYADCWPLMAMYYKNNIQGIGTYREEECGLFTTADKRNRDVMKYQQAYVKKITAELNGFDNVLFDICDEPSLQGLPDGSIIVMPDSIVGPWVLAMKDAFLEAERSLPNKHLLGQTVQNLSPDFSAQNWCQWLPTEYAKPAERALQLDYKFSKPLVNVESNYFGSGLTNNVYTTESVRLEGWWFMMGGGAGCINLNGELHRGQENGGESTRKQIAVQKKILKDFMDRLELKGLSRYDGAGISQGNAFVCALESKGSQYAVYIFHGNYEGAWGAHFLPRNGNYRDTLKLDTVPAGSYTIEWTDPATGKQLNSGTLRWEGGTLLLPTPLYVLDIALYLHKRE